MADFKVSLTSSTNPFPPDSVVFNKLLKNVDIPPVVPLSAGPTLSANMLVPELKYENTLIPTTAKSRITIIPINQGDVKKELLVEPELEVGDIKVVVPEIPEDEEDPVFPEKREDVSGEIALVPKEADGVDTVDAVTVGVVGGLTLVPIVGVRTLVAVFITVYYINSNILLLSTYTLFN